MSEQEKELRRKRQAEYSRKYRLKKKGEREAAGQENDPAGSEVAQSKLSDEGSKEDILKDVFSILEDKYDILKEEADELDINMGAGLKEEDEEQ